ncbi:MAG TPA: glycosyltransferase family 4 protein [Defluviitaleaceae bacterium]|nr:glycosyltransferase family 4 protein [Defluviitaleaceae bacterium]HQD92997.1 glycosyltransferase family 4 protein [Bacilli bacterium]
MKILHIALGGPFNEKMSYHENMLAKENKKAGHNVTIITSCYKWDQTKIVKVPEEDRINDDGIRLIRLELDKILNDYYSKKFRRCNKLMSYLNLIKPDVIFHHGIQGLSLFTVSVYKKRNPNVILYVDNHADKNNSASNWLSLNILHKLFYKTIIKLTIKYYNKVFYISFEAKEFLRDVYNIPEYKLEFYPLGGTIINPENKYSYKIQIRKELKISFDDILLCHSGKMDEKKQTYEILKNFQKVKNRKLKLIIIGAFTDEVKKKVIPLIKRDKRIMYLGWKNSEELIKYIAASDLYLQPGSQSATMQNALCAGTPVLIENVKSHEAYMSGNAFIINNYEDMEIVFAKICEDPSVLKKMSERVYDLAVNNLDYKKLAERICHTSKR